MALLGISRKHKRAPDELRSILFEPHGNNYAEGSCWVSYGQTKVLCTASVDDRVPGFLREQGGGWITAEYGMLPRSTHSRSEREAARGGQRGRTQEIQRVIGRALRSIVNLRTMGNFQIRIDCDVIQADGGTRCASVSGAFVALYFALKRMGNQALASLKGQIAAVSSGIVQGVPLLDLDYEEDARAQVDSNFILTRLWDNPDIQCAEIQLTAEDRPFTWAQLESLKELAIQGCDKLFSHQSSVLT